MIDITVSCRPFCGLLVCLFLAACGGSGSAGHGSPPVGSGTGIGGLPAGPTNAPSITLSIPVDSGLTGVEWYMDDLSGGSPHLLGTGNSLSYSFPEGVLTVTAKLTFASGSTMERHGTITVDRTPPDIRLTDISVRGTTSGPAAVTIHNVADQDAAIDTSFRVDFVLNGGSAATSLPVDGGSLGAPLGLDLPIVVEGVSHDIQLSEL